MAAYQYQLQNARESTAIKNIAGVCSDSDEFVDLVHRATEKLIKRGAWFGTEVVMKMCFTGCRVVWPRYVSSVYGARFCRNGGGLGEIHVKNNWYSILSWPYCQAGNWRSDNIVMRDAGLVPIFNEITGNTGKFLRYHVVKANDYGKTITFYGKKYGGQPLQEKNSDDQWVNGITLTAQNPIAQTTDLVTFLNQVVREETEGMAYLYQYDPTTGDQIMLAAYDPSETNPQYRSSIIDNVASIKCHTDANGQKIRQIEALVKLEYIKATKDRDFLIIDDFTALAFAIQAIKFGEANDYENYQKYLTLAISELNFDSRNKDPGEQFVTQVRVMGSNRIVENPI